jgi:hypothetical protein
MPTATMSMTGRRTLATGASTHDRPKDLGARHAGTAMTSGKSAEKGSGIARNIMMPPRRRADEPRRMHLHRRHHSLLTSQNATARLPLRIVGIVEEPGKMSSTIMFGGLSFVLDEPFATHSQQAPSSSAALGFDALEHGAYYTGLLRSDTAIARWHANKGRFVHAEYSLGRQRVRTLAYIDSGNARDGFCPLALASPKDGQRISDYAFETAH